MVPRCEAAYILACRGGLRGALDRSLTPAALRQVVEAIKGASVTEMPQRTGEAVTYVVVLLTSSTQVSRRVDRPFFLVVHLFVLIQ